MADFNKKPEFRDEDEKVTQETVNKIIIDTVDYTEKRCKRQFRKWLAETVMVVASISIWMCLIGAFVERAKVLPTESYKNMNMLHLLYVVIIILSVVFADCVINRNE